MNTDSLVASLVGSLAWPIAAVILGLIFRRQLRAVFAGLAERMKHLVTFKAPGTELSFGDSLVEAKGELSKAAQMATNVYTIKDDIVVADDTFTVSDANDGPPDFVYLPDGRAILNEVKSASPQYTVMKAWLDVENAIKQLARAMGFIDSPDSPDRFFAYIVALLTKAKEAYPSLDIKSTYNVIERLYDLEDRAGQGAKITRLEALDYATTAASIVSVLRTAAGAVDIKHQGIYPIAPPGD